MSARAELPLGVGTLRVQEVLSGALRDDDDGAPVLEHRPVQAGEEPARPVERERHLRDEDEVGVVHGQRGVAGDEAAVPAHDPHQADAVDRRLRLDPRGLDRLRRGRVRGLEAEALADERDVVVDGLRDADRRRSSRPRDSSTSARPAAPRIDPSPPMTNRMSMPRSTRQSAITSGSWAPRELPRMVPPCSLIVATVSGVSATGAWPSPGTSPAKPCRNPTTSSTP